MKTINNLIHLTESLDVVKSIIKEGFKTSYAVEKFGDRNILVPIISFSNIQFRDIGENEVVDYGKYGIVLDREFGIKINLNPVCYVFKNSVIEQGILNLYDLAIIPQTLNIWKDMADQLTEFTKTTDYVNFGSKTNKTVIELVNNINKNTEINLVHSIKSFSEKIFENAYNQIILMKPYKVLNKKGVEKIAYNEREWRITYPNLGYIFETDIYGKIDKNYLKWINTKKPHFNEPENILKIEIENIKHIVVAKSEEVEMIKNYLYDLYGKNKIEKMLLINKFTIETLETLKQNE